ncbi:hypothetical protein [Roseivirga sp. UBA1976]|uniref:hypothetical protein n=1 Tax=Roseivirga sp. UBA1976 TaxID=1947386 RepID=UPI0025809AA8|nr:hypothetical protein [Roseivirga sp. UBA1976]MEC7753046.1 hypothetical protein [Bacteroidota bacterium]|tara:strand:- start:11257 stop:11475 length:219 start_codon:yes stop_codon:yes gene_type:complete
MKKLFSLLFVVALISSLISIKASAQQDEDDGIVCGTDVCVVDEAKNRFLARGCKSKPDFDCVVGGPGLPSVG